MSRLRPLITEIEAEQESYDERIREIYARVQKAGYDKSAVGQVVRIRRKRHADPEAFKKLGDTVNLYLSEIGNLPHHVGAHTHVGARVASIVPADRPLTIKERARGIVEFAEAKKRGEIPPDADIPEFLKRASG